MEQPKIRRFQNGDKGKLKWGHIIWNSDPNWKASEKYTHLGSSGTIDWYDISPERVGQIVTIENSYKDLFGGNSPDSDMQYSVKFEDGRSLAWIDDNQLDFVNEEV